MFEGGSDRIRTMDGAINANAPTQLSANGEGYKDGIFIHRTNNNGFAGGTVSTGCLLIAPGDWNNFNTQLTPLGNALDNAAGSREFTIIVNRTGSNNDPVMNAPLQNLCTTNRDYVTDENISGGQEIQLNQ